jgi:chromosome condensin MukBEF complex kleisin-like MukF subunit
MEKIYNTDSFESLISKMKESLFDIFIDEKEKIIYFSDGLDVGYIKKEEEELDLGMVLREKKMSYIKADEFPIFNMEKVINRHTYSSVDTKDFFTGATEWLKQNGKLKLLSSL